MGLPKVGVGSCKQLLTARRRGRRPRACVRFFPLGARPGARAMGLWELLDRLFVRAFPGRGHGVGELARRLGLSEEELRALEPVYRPFTLPKRTGGTRHILAPEDRLKAVQRRILRRVLRRLRCHPAAAGFERGWSIVTNALP